MGLLTTWRITHQQPRWRESESLQLGFIGPLPGPLSHETRTGPESDIIRQPKSCHLAAGAVGSPRIGMGNRHQRPRLSCKEQEERISFPGRRANPAWRQAPRAVCPVGPECLLPLHLPPCLCNLHVNNTRRRQRGQAIGSLGACQCRPWPNRNLQ